MTEYKPGWPRVGGIAGGVGTTTVAHLMNGNDVGAIDANGSQPVEVLVTRATAVAVSWAIQTAQAMPVRPVLVVVACSADRWPTVVEQRLKMAETNLSTPVLRLRWCTQLAASDNPWDLLADAVAAEDRKKYRWSNQAREFQSQLIDAVKAILTARRAVQPAPAEPAIHVQARTVRVS